MARWTKMTYAINCLDFALTPSFYDLYNVMYI